MKNIYAILIFITLFSCSNSDNSSDVINNGSFNPPNWIRGSWYQYTNGANPIFVGGFKFTSNQFCNILNSGNSEICTGANDKNITINTNTATEFKFTVNAGLSTTYHFVKYSENQIRLENNDGLLRLYNKQ